jgi:hypothetical protein
MLQDWGEHGSPDNKGSDWGGLIAALVGAALMIMPYIPRIIQLINSIK